jgi:DNA replication protein DnaC
LHRDNDLTTIESLENLYIRDFYSKYYENATHSSQENTFFRGTSGTGKSCFRTYMM